MTLDESIATTYHSDVLTIWGKSVMRVRIVPGLVVATILLASSTAGAISVKAAGQQYVKDVASANAALRTFDSEITAWTNSTADAKGEQQAAPVLSSLKALQLNLLSQTWPPFVKGGVQFICDEDIASLEEDLRMIDNNSSLGNGAFQLTFRADTKTLDYDALYVRRDLGLPSSGSL
jgi:hypothetical protein